MRYIIYDVNADAIADEKVMDVVKHLPENVKFHTSTALVFLACRVLVKRGEINYNDIIFVVNGKSIKIDKNGETEFNLELNILDKFLMELI
jgi:hypothetical protein